MAMVLDVSEWTVLPFPNAGAVPKLFITDGEKDYMIKFAKQRQNKTDIPYHVSEYLSCRIAKSLGYAVQEVSLVTYHGQEACLVTLFDDVLVTFTGLGVSTLDEQEMQYDLDLVDETVMSEKFLFDVQKYVWETFLLDSFICNLDRHPNNWGFFKQEDGYIRAPLFDLGSSLYSINAYSLMKMKDISAYVERHSGSAVKYKDKKHTFKEIVGMEKNGKLSSLIGTFIASLSGIDKTCIEKAIEAFPHREDYCLFVRDFIDIQMEWFNGRCN
ncbi:MAG: HipA domain-containing protein [Defluviitaleaceae bacterium]|nr:HipA domain-containing protein [Defluviitaleaceae bacterium]